MWTPFIFHITYATQGHGKLGVDPRELGDQGMVYPGPWVQPIARQSHTHTHTHSRDGNQTPVMWGKHTNRCLKRFTSVICFQCRVVVISLTVTSLDLLYSLFLTHTHKTFLPWADSSYSAQAWMWQFLIISEYEASLVVKESTGSCRRPEVCILSLTVSVCHTEHVFVCVCVMKRHSWSPYRPFALGWFPISTFLSV